MDIRITEDLWASTMLPEGIVERWTVPDGSAVLAGERVAEVLIEDALHEIAAPASGCLTIGVGSNAVIEPGAVIGQISSRAKQI